MIIKSYKPPREIRVRGNFRRKSTPREVTVFDRQRDAFEAELSFSPSPSRRRTLNSEWNSTRGKFRRAILPYAAS